jgi:DNA-binding MarR family transcriptional regulator
MNDQYIEQLTTYIENAVYFMKQMENTSTAAFSQELNNPELQVMIYLGKSGPRKMSEIADHLSLGVSNLTAIVDKLVGKNLVERYRSERDRRLVMVELTQEG